MFGAALRDGGEACSDLPPSPLEPSAPRPRSASSLPYTWLAPPHRHAGGHDDFDARATESPDLRRRSMNASSSATTVHIGRRRKKFASTCSRLRPRTLGPSCVRCPRMTTPKRACSTFARDAPAATRTAVLARRWAPATTITRAVFCQYVLVGVAGPERVGDVGVVPCCAGLHAVISSAIGGAVVTPSRPPERISTSVGFARCVTWRDVPGPRPVAVHAGYRRSQRQAGGHPSTTQPMADHATHRTIGTQKACPGMAHMMCLRNEIAGRV